MLKETPALAHPSLSRFGGCALTGPYYVLDTTVSEPLLCTDSTVSDQVYTTLFPSILVTK